VWEIIGRSRVSGVERNVITDSWSTVMRLAKRGLDKGWRIRIRQVYRDILIADTSGQFMVAAQKLTHQKAIEFYHCYSQIDAERGCVIWPHGQKLPEGWKIVG
jgi:hypothetical protein